MAVSHRLECNMCMSVCEGGGDTCVDGEVRSMKNERIWPRSCSPGDTNIEGQQVLSL